MNIYIVEDEILCAMILDEFVKKSGHNVVNISASGEDAFQQIVSKRNEIDLIITDLYLLNDMLTGIDVIEMLQESNINIPVIYITAMANDTEMIERIGKANKCKFVRLIDKPVFDGHLKMILNDAEKFIKNNNIITKGNK
jgi:response regulator of citrate/malate metabolism